MPFIETSDRTSLFYKDWGTGKPVLFLHGWCLGTNMWEYQMTPQVRRSLGTFEPCMKGSAMVQ